MKFKTHVIGGISAGVVANSWMIEQVNSNGNETTSILLSSLFLAGSVVGSITPDIDHRGSYIGRRMKITSAIFGIFSWFAKFVNKLNRKLFGIGDSKSGTMISHRGITHTPILVIAIMALFLSASMNLFSGFSTVLFSYLSIGFGIGMLSHILLDALTKGGAPLLYPFTKKKFSFLPITTGGLFEQVIAFSMVVCTLLYVTGIYSTLF